jgi:uncharacterized membrane protein (UPF0127 family)
MRFFVPVLAALTLAAYGCGEKDATLEDLRTRIIGLPNGRQIRAEVMIQPVDLQRGMMFRDSLEPGRGMLFLHDRPGPYEYYMFQVRIPLDILWMGPGRNIVEIAANCPPCRTKASECPKYGGHFPAQYVLELAAGEAARNNLRTGDTLTF